MKEYAAYKEDFTYMIEWAKQEKLKAAPPPLPYPKIFIRKDAVMTDKFSPPSYTAVAGDFVTWFNDDTNLHRVISGTGPNDPTVGKEFDSGESGPLALTAKGKAFAHEFAIARKFSYFCKIHPTEIGEIIVKDNTSHKSVDVKEKLIKLLREGKISEFNQIRYKSGMQPLDLSGANLSDLDLSEVDLSSTNLSKVNFARSRLERASLMSSDLSGADFSEANLKLARLFYANISSATNLSKTNLEEAQY
jgi:plastocyanin